jgi:hypothetical protein
MATFPPQPSSPTEWKQYAESDVVTSVPLRSDEHSNEHPDEQASCTHIKRSSYSRVVPNKLTTEYLCPA